MKKLALVLLATLISCADHKEDEPYVRPPIDSEEPWVLVDLYHTTKQNPVDYRLEKGEFGYQGVFGFWRAFEHIKNNGYEWTSIRTEPLSAPRLEGFDVLFINLLSEDRPDFTDDEIEAILDFVREGGGLFVIADHTNVYRHAERINRFLIPMGIEVTYHTATDQPPEHSVAGLGWTLTWDLVPHPVTADLELISLQTGGPMISKSGGLAFTSENSFADYWDPNAGGGLFGNWRWDGDQNIWTVTVNDGSQSVAVEVEGNQVMYDGSADETPELVAAGLSAAINADPGASSVVTAISSGATVKITALASWETFTASVVSGDATIEETLSEEELEKKGPLEVLAAESYGEGRVVVAGDQNMFGDAWLHFGDNFELFMNAMEWAAKRDGAETPLRSIRPMGFNIGLFQRQTSFGAGRNSNNGFFHYFVNANRDLEVTTRANLNFDGKDDAMFVMSPESKFSEEELGGLAQYLKDGKRLVITFGAERLNDAAVNEYTRDVIAAVAPDFNMNGHDVTSDDFGVTVPPKLEGAMDAVSARLDVSGLALADYASGADSAGGLWDTTSTWGDAFLQAEMDGKTVDIARSIKTPEGGELIIWMQDGLFRGRSMGEYLRVPTEWNSPQIELQYRLQDFLRTPVEE